jgi:hypothetical protein
MKILKYLSTLYDRHHHHHHQHGSGAMDQSGIKEATNSGKFYSFVESVAV